MAKGDYLGEFEHVVLLAVARLRGEGYGVSIRKEIERRTGREVSIGAVYATLDRIEDKGLLESRDGDPTPVRGGRSKRHFRMLPAGARALEASRAMLDRMWEGVELDEVGS
jgi:DNA-binding PadR family transcriptional regulator